MSRLPLERPVKFVLVHVQRGGDHDHAHFPPPNLCREMFSGCVEDGTDVIERHKPLQAWLCRDLRAVEGGESKALALLCRSCSRGAEGEA